MSKADQLAGVTSNFAYDPIYELTQVTQGTNTTESYSYDPVGNRLTSLSVPSYTYNSSNELTANSNGSYTYDANGNTLTDAAGTSYTWDFDNRLTGVTLPGTGGSVSFEYDPFGRRIEKIGPSATTVYVYDGDGIVETTDQNGNETAKYVQGLGIDEPLAMNTGGASYFFEQDGLGTVTSLTNLSGSLSNTYTYDSFGNLTASTGTVSSPFEYTGREFDPETGLYSYRARYYDPTAGRLLSEDPIRFFSGSADFYGYVDDDPVNLVDPFGLRATKAETAACIRRALEALFPGVVASVDKATKATKAARKNGGHWNFAVQLRFPSYQDAYSFYSAIASHSGGFYPPARFGPGPALHLEGASEAWAYGGGVWTTSGSAHIDLYNPNGTSLGGGGIRGFVGHVGVDGILGHLAQFFGSNIDPSRCPWGGPCEK
jgi:RHS repeat-associated protein